MYSLNAFGNMIADATRVEAYSKAIAAAVRHGDVVADIGCGAGLFSLLACRAGARRVFAIEADDCIQLARELAQANGLADRIEFLQSESTSTELPERANVIVSDIRGVLPLFQNAIPVLDDARKRFLCAGGIMIPRQDTLKAGLIDAHEYYCDITSPWEKPIAGLDLSSPLSQALNRLHSSSFRREQLVSEPKEWGVLDYATGAQASLGAELEFVPTREGMAHGICLWFETNLFADIRFSTQPGDHSVYGQMFLPWLKAVAVHEGMRIHVALRADLFKRDYVWRWETTVPATGGQPQIRFTQSSFQGAPFAPQSLRHQELHFIPTLSETGEAELWILQQMRGDQTLQSIAQGALERFPSVFSSRQAAFNRVAELSNKLSR